MVPLTKTPPGGIVKPGGEGMNVLPRASEAVIPSNKITYALSEPNKAYVFKEVLGYDVSNASALRDNILRTGIHKND